MVFYFKYRKIIFNIRSLLSISFFSSVHDTVRVFDDCSFELFLIKLWRPRGFLLLVKKKIIFSIRLPISLFSSFHDTISVFDDCSFELFVNKAIMTEMFYNFKQGKTSSLLWVLSWPAPVLSWHWWYWNIRLLIFLTFLLCKTMITERSFPFKQENKSYFLSGHFWPSLCSHQMLKLLDHSMADSCNFFCAV